VPTFHSLCGPLSVRGRLHGKKGRSEPEDWLAPGADGMRYSQTSLKAPNAYRSLSLPGLPVLRGRTTCVARVLR
jgi:hypothetical protein